MTDSSLDYAESDTSEAKDASTILQYAIAKNATG